MTIFGLYTCKQVANKATHRKAAHIARESSEGGIMKKELFFNVTKSLLEMSSTRFLKALVEIKYMQEFYTETNYEKLGDAIEEIC